MTLSGTWTVADERIDPGPDTGLVLDYSAAKVSLVLGGEGIATVTDKDGARAIEVSGAPTRYELRAGPPGPARLALQLDDMMSAYALTFG